jgi:two-component system phosphate regulon response regulator PhoB
MALWQEIEEPEILFIGDNYDVAEMYRIKLELDGYRVRVAERAAAIEQVRRRPPDLLYVDLTERSSHDLKLLARVRKEARRPDLPAVLLSPLTEREFRDQGMQLSSLDYAVRTRPFPELDS